MFKSSLKIVLRKPPFELLALSESSSAVMLLLHAGWMMLKNASNQGGANSLTVASPAADAGRFDSCISQKWALCSWGHVTTIFLKIFYIMGYNLKITRNGKSISKIPKWRSLRSLALKNKILWWFEFQNK